MAREERAVSVGKLQSLIVNYRENMVDNRPFLRYNQNASRSADIGKCPDSMAGK